MFTGLVTCGDGMPGINSKEERLILAYSQRAQSIATWLHVFGQNTMMVGHLMDRLLPLVVDKNQRAQAHLQ